MKNIKAIIFDLGGVLLNINYNKTINSFNNIGIKNAKSLYSKKSQTNLFNQIETGKISEKDFLDVLKNKTKKATINEVKNAWNSMLLDLPEKRISILKNLKEKYALFLLSNTNKIHISEFKRKISIPRYKEFYNLFDKVYYSHKIGYRKPNETAFKIILDENNLAPEEVFFIDDSPQHIDGAKKIGIKTYHISKKADITTLFPDIILSEHH